jgi:hypothetical protein
VSLYFHSSSPVSLWLFGQCVLELLLWREFLLSELRRCNAVLLTGLEAEEREFLLFQLIWWLKTVGALLAMSKLLQCLDSLQKVLFVRELLSYLYLGLACKQLTLLSIWAFCYLSASNSCE